MFHTVVASGPWIPRAVVKQAREVPEESYYLCASAQIWRNFSFWMPWPAPSPKLLQWNNVTENREFWLKTLVISTALGFLLKTVTTLLTSVLVAFVGHLLELCFYAEFLFKRTLPACVWRMLFKWETAVPLQALGSKPAWSSQEQNKGAQNLCHRWMFVW